MIHWLCLDIGNTHTVAGLFEHPSSKLIARVRFRTDPEATSDEYFSHLSQIFIHHLKSQNFWNGIQRAIISTVVPSLEAVVTPAFQILGHRIPCLFIHSETRREFELELPYPNQLGADRLANVAGALSLAPSPFLIVDAGTATTFCLVDDRPAYLGGAIVPGLEIGFKALQTKAAKLFSVELKRPTSSIGKTTETQLTSGVLLSYEAMIEGMTDLLLKDWHALSPKSFRTPTFFATGGSLHYLKLSRRFQVEMDLTLIGLYHYGTLTQ